MKFHIFPFLLLNVFLITVNPVYSSVLREPNRVKIKQLLMKGHKPLTDYALARKYLMTKVHKVKVRDTFIIKEVYCEQVIKLPTENSMPSANLVNTEHTWPQSRFNHRADSLIQKSDLHHLYPTNAQANSMRGNHPFTEVEHDKPVFSKCPGSKMGMVENSDKIGFEPPDSHKGNVARALFYFSVRYDIEISEEEEEVLRQWHNLDQIDEEEIRRNNMIEKIQGNRNPFIDSPELVSKVLNF